MEKKVWEKVKKTWNTELKQKYGHSSYVQLFNRVLQTFNRNKRELIFSAKLLAAQVACINSWIYFCDALIFE